MRRVEWLKGGRVERVATKYSLSLWERVEFPTNEVSRWNSGEGKLRPILSYTVILNLFQNLVEILR